MNDYQSGFNILIDVLDVNKPGDSGQSPLMICSACTQGHIYAQKLISKGANPNYQDVYYGETALMKAAMYNNKKMIEILLPVSNTKIKSHNGYTAYDLALSENNLEIAKVLI